MDNSRNAIPPIGTREHPEDQELTGAEGRYARSELNDDSLIGDEHGKFADQMVNSPSRTTPPLAPTTHEFVQEHETWNGNNMPGPDVGMMPLERERTKKSLAMDRWSATAGIALCAS